LSDNIGTIIMKKRKQLGYTQQKIADCLNVSFQAVSKWENGGSLR
jgi:tellurite methyltransferase